MPQPRTSIADLARALHLSPSTVSRALAGNAQISASTQQRVRQTAAELDYHPHPVAAALRKGRTTTLGVLVPHLSGSFFPDIIEALPMRPVRPAITCCWASRTKMNSRKSSKSSSCHRRKWPGCWCPWPAPRRSSRTSKPCARPRYPWCFSTGCRPQWPGRAWAPSWLMTTPGPTPPWPTWPRRAGSASPTWRGRCTWAFTSSATRATALRAHGLPYHADWLHISDLQQPAGAAGLAQLLQLSQPPDAVFSAGDSAAVGGMQAAKEQGLRIPHDLALVGFSNAEFSGLTEPPLTTVDQCSHLMGQAAGRRLHVVADCPAPPPVVLAPALLVRGSSQVLASVVR